LTLKQHTRRHEILHAAGEEWIGDYIRHNSVTEEEMQAYGKLLTWSHRQRIAPDHYADPAGQRDHDLSALPVCNHCGGLIDDPERHVCRMTRAAE
jgi:hypothetical protein